MFTCDRPKSRFVIYANGFTVRWTVYAITKVFIIEIWNNQKTIQALHYRPPVIHSIQSIIDRRKRFGARESYNAIFPNRVNKRGHRHNLCVWLSLIEMNEFFFKNENELQQHHILINTYRILIIAHIDNIYSQHWVHTRDHSCASNRKFFKLFLFRFDFF